MSLQGANCLFVSGENRTTLCHEAGLIENVLLATLKCSLGIEEIGKDIVWGTESILVLKWTIETFGFEAMFCVEMY